MEDKIVSEARKWLGTNFRHQGRVKNVGCDCVGLLVGVFKSLNIKGRNGDMLHDYDRRNYGRIPDGKYLKREFDTHLDEVNISHMSAGNILMFKFTYFPQHIGILTKYKNNCFGVIHCYAEAGRVVEHRLDDLWRKRIVAAYRVPKIQ